MKKKHVTVTDIYAKYAKLHLPVTRSAWRAKIAWGHLSPVFGDKTPEQISPNLVAKYCDDRGVSDSTLNRELTTLAAALSYGRKIGMTTAAPFIQKRPATASRDRVLTDGEQANLLAECSGPLLLYVQLALLTAQRREAIVGLRWGQVNFQSKFVDFRDPSAKNQARMKGRGIVPLAGDLLTTLDEAGRYNMILPEAYVIGEWSGDAAKLAHPFRAACNRADIAGVTPHDLRHTVATRLVRRGVPLLEVSRLLGHKSVLTTEKHYLSLTPDYIANAAMQLTLV